MTISNDERERLAYEAIKKYTTAEGIIVGLRLFMEHGHTDTAAEHDVFYAGCKDELSEAEERTLCEYGWSYDDEVDNSYIFT